jgi:hypothetical protein
LKGSLVLRLANWTITLGLIVQKSKVRLCENSPLRYSGETHVMFFLAQAISIAFFGWKEHKNNNISIPQTEKVSPRRH